MPKFRYTPQFSCIYTDRALEVNPGDVVEWDEMPGDGRWEPIDSETTDGAIDNFPDEQARAELAEAEQPVDEQPPAEQQAKKTTRRAAQTTEE